jgi:hemoglobin
MGGPAAYTNEQLERVHARLKITEPDFYEMVELLRETLEDYDMSDEDVDAVADGMISRKNYIIARS